jgi:hypothetical protein
MIEAERRLMRIQCFDGRPGLSATEIGLATGLGDHMDTAELRQRYLQMFGFAPGLRRDLPSLFAYGYRNVEAALAQILGPVARGAQARGLGRVTVSPRPLAYPTTYTLGSYAVTTVTPLSPKDALPLRIHLLKEFRRKGVLFTPGDLNVSVKGSGTATNRGAVVTVAFPAGQCSGNALLKSLKKPAKSSKRPPKSR